MNSQKATTAIVLFARRAEDEAIHKCLIPSSNRNLALHNELLNAITASAKKAKGTFIHYHNGLQEGQNFGERITNCITNIFHQGFQNIVLIGGDSPDLTTNDINEACAALEDDKFILGADQHGGAYLIGFKQDQFEPNSFKKLKWNSDKLFSDLSNYTKNPDQLYLLKQRIGLDSKEDLLVYSTVSTALQLMLSRVFDELFQFDTEASIFIQQDPKLVGSRRGPPALV